MFSNSVVNTGRQVALDYAKGIAVICMVLCHTIIYFSADCRDNFWFYFGDQVLGGPTVAPLFMVCLGAGICFSHRSSTHYLLRRGLMFLVGGYLLNVLRGGGFAIMGGLIEGWHDNSVGVNFEELSFFANFIVDILQFAGMAFLFFAVVLWLKLNNWVLVSCAVVFPLIGHCFIGFDSGNQYVNALLGLLIPTGENNEIECIACFPFTIWILYPIVGYLFGKLLQHVTDLKLFYEYLFYPSAAISFVYIVMIIIVGPHPLSGTYYWHTLPNALFYLSLDVAVISGLHMVSPYVPEIVDRVLCGLSRHLTRIYCVSWSLIIWIMIPYELIVGSRNVDGPVAYLCGVLILGSSCFIEKKSRDLGWF